MNASKATGLGEPEPLGKKALFQPPREVQKEINKPTPKPIPIATGRVRTTISLTKRALTILQDHQHRYRMDTGRALPKWKFISDALEFYEEKTKGEGSEE